MSFRPNVHDELTLNGITYRIAEHPAAPGIPYGQEGRAGIVYQLLPSPTGRGVGGEGAMALKVFRARFRTPALVSQAEKLAAFADLPGLTVCRRTVLTPQRNADLLRREPDLTYAVLMPWIEGPTWVEVMLEKRPLTPQQALDLARAFADLLSRMEQNGIAHCDLSGPNVLLPMLAGQTADGRPQTAYRPPSTVELVDVEGLYAPSLPRPEALPSGSSGYAHRTAREGLWGPTADRFAGAVLLAEMLGWGDETVREACYGETYFDPAEMPSLNSPLPPGEGLGVRAATLLSALARHYGQPVTDLFERAWTSETLADCPTFGEWLVALPLTPSPQPPSPLPQVGEGKGVAAQPPGEEVRAAVDATAEIRAFMQVARRFEEQNNYQAALEAYRQALELAQADSSLRSLAYEIELTVQDVEKRAVAQSPSLRPLVETPAPPVSPLPLGVPFGDDKGPGVREVSAERRRKPGWGFWLLWVLANAMSWAVGFNVQNAIGVVLVMFLGGSIVSILVRATFGTVVGIAQLAVLHKHVHKIAWWVPITILGWAISAIFWEFGLYDAISIVIIVGVEAAWVGAFQSLLLSKHVYKATWWIPINTIGTIIGWIVVQVVQWPRLVMGWAIGLYFDYWASFAWAAVGSVNGAITGAVLVWLLRQPRPEDERKSQPE
jgi:hypothetical protein